MLDSVALLLAAMTHQKAGELAEAEAIYRRVLAADPDQPSALFLLGSLALATDRAVEAAVLLGRAVAIRPDHEQQRLALSRALLACGRPDDALRTASPLAGAPGDGTRSLVEAHFLCGTALNALRRPTDAVAAFARALAADPDHPYAALNLGNAWADLDQLDRAEDGMRRAITLHPGLPEAHASLGHLLTRRGRLDEAVAACDRAIALRPDFAQAHWNQGIAFLLAGRLAEGWDKYEWRKRRYPAEFSAPAGPCWDGTAPGGRTLLVQAEQGFGDTVQLARYLPLIVAGGARVLVRCARPMAPLLSALPGVTVLGECAEQARYHAWADQMSLPRLFGTRLDTIPAASGYLRPDPVRAAAWDAGLPPRLPGGRRIGLAWSGNPAHSNDARRSMLTAALAPLVDMAAACPGTSLVSLQVGPRASEVTRLFGVPDRSAALTDFAETAAAIACLDLVVTVDTCVAHVAGALGIPALVMLPHAPDWRWMLDREDTPWYSSLRLVRQRTPGDWAGVIRRVTALLADRNALAA